MRRPTLTNWICCGAGRMEATSNSSRVCPNPSAETRTHVAITRIIHLLYHRLHGTFDEASRRVHTFCPLGRLTPVKLDYAQRFGLPSLPEDTLETRLLQRFHTRVVVAGVYCAPT